MKKVLKTIAGIALACAIAFTAVPQTAHAALRTDGAVGQTYKVYTTYPGNVKVYANVTVTQAKKFTTYKGTKKSSVMMTIKYPKSQQKKIKNNVAKIINSSPVVKNSGFTRYHRGSIPFVGTVMMADSNYVTSLATTGNTAAITWNQFYGKGFKYLRQGNCRMEFYPEYQYYFEAECVPSQEGNLLFGVAGAKKKTYDNNKALKKFANGEAPFTSTTFYHSSKGKYSAWVRM